MLSATCLLVSQEKHSQIISPDSLRGNSAQQTPLLPLEHRIFQISQAGIRPSALHPVIIRRSNTALHWNSFLFTWGKVPSPFLRRGKCRHSSLQRNSLCNSIFSQLCCPHCASGIQESRNEFWHFSFEIFVWEPLQNRPFTTFTS